MLVIAALTEQLITLVVGFALTTIVGGLLGAYFQRRTWDHQNERTLAEADRSHATQTCRELSQLMDKRLYRMLQVRWALFSDTPDRATSERRMEDYRAVLFEWDDNLMRNLAAAEIEFRAGVRDRLEGEIYEWFKATGNVLEVRYARIRSSIAQQDKSGAIDVETVDRALALLRAHIYQINLEMLSQIRDGRVGRNAPARQT